MAVEPLRAVSFADAPQPTQSGWAARLALTFDVHDTRTSLTHREHVGPLRVQRPFYPEGPQVCHVYVLHPPGGLVGGDALQVDVRVNQRAHALLTTPAAGKFYRSAGALARQEQRIYAAEHAKVEWLPQENIVFNGARARVRTRIDLAMGAQFIGWDMVCLGRPAASERFDAGEWHASFEVWRAARPLMIERAVVAGGADVLHAPWGWRGASVAATLIATGRHSEHLEDLRALADSCTKTGLCGMTQLDDDTLVARYLGHDAEEARRLLQRLWAELRPRVMQRAPCPPRIWET